MVRWECITNYQTGLSVSQNQNLEFNPIYKIPLDVLLKSSEGEIKSRFWINSTDTIVKIPMNGFKLQYYIIDPNYILLANIQELKSNELWEQELKSDFSYYSLNRAIEFLFPTKKALTEKDKEIALQLLNSRYENIRIKGAHLVAQKFDSSP